MFLMANYVEFDGSKFMHQSQGTWLPVPSCSTMFFRLAVKKWRKKLVIE